jgi:hypothetical protein
MVKSVIRLGPSPKIKCKIGDIIRYDSGPTALMRIEAISKNHGVYGTDRYYGRSFYGSSVGVYDYDANKATAAEIKKYKTDNHLNRLKSQ